MPTQIHIYTINRGRLDTFASEWRDKIKPLREKFGFAVSGGWKVKDTSQFIWFLSRDSAADRDAQNQAFYKPVKRRTLQPDPARHIARVEQYFVESV